MKFIAHLNKPEYVFRPAQVYQRVLRQFTNSLSEFENVLLPWGLTITVRPDEAIGHSILTTGIYDLSVTEVIYRLLNPGETAMDIGANIGYMTSIMAKKVGSQGEVWAYEPHPGVFEELSKNTKDWQHIPTLPKITVLNIALSNKTGEGLLNIPHDFVQNRGIASLQLTASENLSATNYKVKLVKLDDLHKTLNNSHPIHLIKIDVEGHELEVLQGANEFISQQKIRDVIFEEHEKYPNPVTQYLETHGYTVFRIWKGFWKPLLIHPQNNPVHPWLPPSYLATSEPSRAIESLKKLGWSSLKTPR